MADSPIYRGKYYYRLPDPFRRIAYLPLGAEDLAEHLDISYRTAQRVCKGESKLRPCEVLYLQSKLFGLILDPVFMKQRLAFKNGALISHNDDNFEIPAGEITEYVLFARQHKLWVTQLAQDLKIAKSRIEELTSPPKPTNIIDFKQAAGKRKSRPIDDLEA